MPSRENIELLEIKDPSAYSESKSYLLSQEGLFTNYDKRSRLYKNRYALFYKNPATLFQIIESLCNFVLKIADYKNTSGNADSILGYVRSEACVNLRLKLPTTKDVIYRKLEEIFAEIFSDQQGYSYTESSDGFRVLKKKSRPTFDFKTGKMKEDSIMIVVHVIEDKMDAFIKEQELAEDLFLVKDNHPAEFHFLNSSKELSLVTDLYDKDNIYVLGERNTRIHPDVPIVDGKFNFIKDSEGKIGSRIADVAVYDEQQKPTYFSVKSFGGRSTSKVHLISIGLMSGGMIEYFSNFTGEYLQTLIGNRYQSIAEYYNKSEKSSAALLKEILFWYKSDNGEEKYRRCLNRLKDGYINSIREFLNSTFFKNWGINPVKYLQIFRPSLVEWQLKLTDTDDIWYTENKEELVIADSLVNKDVVEDFLKNAFGYGYILAAIRNRMLYLKDYRDKPIDEQCFKIDKYLIVYPTDTRKYIEIRIRTKAFTVIGFLTKLKKITSNIWPDTFTFFYCCNDFDKFFGLKDPSNEIFSEGFLLNSGFLKGRPKFDTSLI